MKSSLLNIAIDKIVYTIKEKINLVNKKQKFVTIKSFNTNKKQNTIAHKKQIIKIKNKAQLI